MAGAPGVRWARCGAGVATVRAGERLPLGEIGGSHAPPSRLRYRGATAHPARRLGGRQRCGWVPLSGRTPHPDGIILVGGGNVYRPRSRRPWTSTLWCSPRQWSADGDVGNVLHAIVQPGDLTESGPAGSPEGSLVAYKQPRTTSSSAEKHRDDAGKVRRTALRAEADRGARRTELSQGWRPARPSTAGLNALQVGHDVPPRRTKNRTPAKSDGLGEALRQSLAKPGRSDISGAGRGTPGLRPDLSGRLDHMTHGAVARENVGHGRRRLDQDRPSGRMERLSRRRKANCGDKGQRAGVRHGGALRLSYSW